MYKVDHSVEDSNMAEKEKIFVRRGSGRPEPLEEVPFEREDELQELIADYPELLAGERIDPDSARRWILIKREQGIPDRPDAGDRWSVDGQVPGRGVRVRHPDCTAQAAVDCVSGASCSASCFVVTPGVR